MSADQGTNSAAPTSADRLDFLIPDLQAGDTAAYRTLYSLMADRLFRAAYRMLRDRLAAEDVVQESFLQLVARGCPPTNGPALEAWLFTNIRFRCGDEFRRRKRQPAIPTDRFDDQIDLSKARWAGYEPVVERALAELTPLQALIVHLKYVEQLDGNTIAAVVGSNRVAVYAAAARAERTLRRRLEQLDLELSPLESQRRDGDASAKGPP